MGLPGALPVPNKSAVEKSALFGISVNSKINAKLQFSRKNYFYPDLPKGYQTSQFSLPICERGKIRFFHDGVEKVVNLTRAHLEEDAGKLIHSVQDQATYIDLNRCGSPLLEIVSEPDLRSASEARSYLNQLKQANVPMHSGINWQPAARVGLNTLRTIGGVGNVALAGQALLDVGTGSRHTGNMLRDINEMMGVPYKDDGTVWTNTPAYENFMNPPPPAVGQPGGPPVERFNRGGLASFVL